MKADGFFVESRKFSDINLFIVQNVFKNNLCSVYLSFIHISDEAQWVKTATPAMKQASCDSAADAKKKKNFSKDEMCKNSRVVCQIRSKQQQNKSMWRMRKYFLQNKTIPLWNNVEQLLNAKSNENETHKTRTNINKILSIISSDYLLVQLI